MNNLVRLAVFSMVSFIAFYGPIKANSSAAQAMTSMMINGEQKLVLAGFADNGTNNDFALVRMNLDASYDTTFNPTGANTSQAGQVVTNINGNNAAINAITIDAQNRIVVAGTAIVSPLPTTFTATFNSSTQFCVARYNEDGSLDNTFNSTGTFPGGPGVAIIPIGTINDTPLGIAIDSVGRIVIVGTTDNGVGTDIAIVRLTDLGNLDVSFTTTPPMPMPGSLTNAVPTPGLITITPGIQVLTINGNDVATCVTIGSSDNIFIGGYTTNSLNQQVSLPSSTQVALAKILNSTSGLDPTFFNMDTSPFPGVILQSVNGIQDQINAIGIDANESLVLAGFTSIVEGFTELLLVRYTQTGELFETVQTDVLASNAVINALTFDTNNNIVVTGSFEMGQQTFDFTGPANLAFLTARYLLDGSLDPTFNPLGINGILNAGSGIVITNVIPTSTIVTTNTFFGSNDNQGTGVVTDANNTIYVAGYSNGGTQDNFTTVSYIANAILNTGPTISPAPGFNAEAQQQGSPGIAENVFFGTVQLGNGVPLLLNGDTSFLGTRTVEQLRADALNYVNPEIESEDGSLITNDPKPALTGKASPNASITLLVNDVAKGYTVADHLGNWSARLTKLANGTYTVIALATDPITSVNLTSEPVSLTVELEAPRQPTIEAPAQDQVITTARVTLQGKAQPHSLVTIYIDNKSVGQAESPTGTWSFETAELKNGEQTVYVDAEDEAGNVSVPSEKVTFKIETGQQRAPRILQPKQAVVVKSTPLKLMGEGKPSTSLNLYVNDKYSAAIKIDNKGKWAYNLPVKEGDYQIYVSTSDKQLSSELVKFTVDLTPPRKTQAQPKPGKGLLNGQAEPGNVVTLFLDGTQIAKVVTDSLGSWTYTPPPDHPIEKGKHLLKISIADATGKIKSLIDQEITL